MIDIDAAIEFIQVYGRFLLDVICFIHFLSKNAAVYLYGIAGFVILLKIERDISSCRVGIGPQYLIVTINGGLCRRLKCQQGDEG